MFHQLVHMNHHPLINHLLRQHLCLRRLPHTKLDPDSESHSIGHEEGAVNSHAFQIESEVLSYSHRPVNSCNTHNEKQHYHQINDHQYNIGVGQEQCMVDAVDEALGQWVDIE